MDNRRVPGVVQQEDPTPYVDAFERARTCQPGDSRLGCRSETPRRYSGSRPPEQRESARISTGPIAGWDLLELRGCYLVLST
jgi:hypothetical protein